MSLKKLREAARAAWRPQDLRFAWEWCQDNVFVDNTSPFPGWWRLATSPWVREPMEVYTDKLVQEIVIRCSAQSSKTQTVLNLIAYDIVEDPGPEMYVLANKEDAADFIEDRFSPMLDMCKKAKELLIRSKGMRFTFRTMPLYFVGAGSKAKLQGKPIKRLKLDEVRNYPPGALQTVLKRVRAFSSLAQVLIISTPDMENDELDARYKAGDQRTYHFSCPICGHMQSLRLERLRWDTNAETKPNGQWDFDKLALTIRYVCESCEHQIRDTPAERKMICRSGKFIRMNPNAPRHIVSFTWNALLPWWVPWRSIVEEFLKARAAARHGDVQAMKTFVTETLGEPWKDSLGVIEDFGFLEARKDDYEMGVEMSWPERRRRFMAADRQEKGGEHYWWVIREFGGAGKSRLVAYGKAMTLQELEQIRRDYKIPSGDCMIDTAYETQATYRFCMSTGWRAFKGDQVQFYLITMRHPRHPALKITVRQIWRKTQAVVYHSQTRAKVGVIGLFTFSSDSTKDVLTDYMRGQLGDWTISKQVERHYLRQMTAERRLEQTDTKGRVSYQWHRQDRDNHFFDCEQMILIAAIITKVINAPPVKGAAVQKKEGQPGDVPTLTDGERQSAIVDDGTDSVGGEQEQERPDSPSGWSAGGTD